MQHSQRPQYRRNTTVANAPVAQGDPFAPPSDGSRALAAPVSGLPDGFHLKAVMDDRQRRELDGPRGVVEMALKEAKRMDADFFYSWTVKTKDGPKAVEGCSIDGARMLERVWGNCGVIVTEEDEMTHWRFCATFLDLEAGVPVLRLYRQRKSESHGNYEDERQLDIAYQIGQSKAIRNVICDAIPSWLQRDCLAAAKTAAALKLGAVEIQWPKFLERLLKRGVSEDQVRARLHLAPGVAPSPEDIGTLVAIGKAIEQGQTTIEVEFFGELKDAPDFAKNGATPASPAGGPPPPAETPPSEKNPADVAGATETPAKTTAASASPDVPTASSAASSAATTPPGPAVTPPSPASPAGAPSGPAATPPSSASPAATPPSATRPASVSTATSPSATPAGPAAEPTTTGKSHGKR